MLCHYRMGGEGEILTNEEFKKVLGIFYGNNGVNVPAIMSAEPNDDMAKILFKMLQEAAKKSNQLKWVPIVKGGRPGPTLIVNYLIQIARDPKGLKSSAITSVAAYYRSDMQDAAGLSLPCQKP